MNVNGLNKRVTIYKYDRSENAAGTPVEQFLFYRYVYANIKVLSGGLQNDTAPGSVAVSQIEITIRHDELVDYNCKLVYDKNSYRINYIEEIDSGGFLKLRCYLYNENHPGS
jgi:SPP1 family predicted phage head-tail adaptor